MIFSLILLTIVWVIPKSYIPIYEQRTQSNFLKFIASLIVVLGHQTIFYCKSSRFFITEIGDLGGLCVAFFLFMSGYGLLYGYQKRNKKLSINWLLTRIFKLTIPAITAMILYLVIKFLCGKSIDWNEVFKWWFISDINLRYGWYVTEIIALYLIFFICYKYINPKYSLKYLCCLIIIAMIIMIICNKPVWYIKGLPCFLIGLLFAKNENSLPYIFNKKIYSQLFITLLIFIFYILKDSYRIQNLIPSLSQWRYIYASFYFINIIFILIIAYIITHLPICKIMKNEGRYYYEIYLVQGATLLLCRELIKTDLLFIPIGFILTIHCCPEKISQNSYC